MSIKVSNDCSSKAIIILGSSRSDGNTKSAIKQLDPDNQISFVDLNNLNITPFDYQHKNQKDDYIPLMRRIVLFDHIILATPVYWYTMSAQMKIFIDRLSDLLTIEKETGRMLRGKKLSVLASYTTSLPEGFELAFSQTCKYMGIDYSGCFFFYSGEDKILMQKNVTISEFRSRVFDYE